jgi:hypothetical protein
VILVADDHDLEFARHHASAVLSRFHGSSPRARVRLPVRMPARVRA